MTENERNHKGKLGGRTLNIAKWTDKFKYGMIYLIFLNKENIATLANYVFSLFLLQIQAVGTGWVSLALTFRGSMMGSDVLVGWVSEKGAATIMVSYFIRIGDTSLISGLSYCMMLWFQFLNAKDKSISKEYHTGSAPSNSVSSLYWHQGGSR